MPLRVLTWNLMHGRAVPPAGRDLLDEFAAALAGWVWDAALLQEVPPWWPAALAEATGADWRRVLTSRNFGLAARRAAAARAPDLIKSNGGGSNAILLRRSAGQIAEHRALSLARWPERRRMHAIRLAGGGWVGNLHCSVRADAKARAEAALAARTLLRWATGEPAALGGDFNVRGLALAEFTEAGHFDVDYVFTAAGWSAGGPASALDRGRLSDHAPVAVAVSTSDDVVERPGRA